jgi:UDPglucose 6-dehydrogenase
MKDYTISIIGYGYVGSAMGSLCEKNNVEFNVCDLNPKEGNFNYFNNVSDLVNFSETTSDINFYVIAVPTPSDLEGNCDTSIVRNILSQLKMLVNKETYTIIKSTIVPGTARNFNELFPELNIVFSPEFLTEKNYLDDIYNAKFVILGIPPKFDMSKYQKILKVMRLFYKHNSQIDIFMRSYEEAELFKYTVNNFLATKITFFNEIHELCEKMDVDYQKLKELFKLDSRVGEYGTIVPGPGNEFYGFHLGCLPKETRAMIKLQEKLELSNELMVCIDKRNNYFKNKQVEK